MNIFGWRVTCNGWAPNPETPEILPANEPTNQAPNRRDFLMQEFQGGMFVKNAGDVTAMYDVW